jgi:hypothetical protein
MIRRSSLALVLVVTITATAWAGRKDSAPVVIDLGARTASGSLGSARNSPDPYSAIGCSVHYDYVNGKNNVNCAATDASGTSVVCASQQPELVQIALGIDGDSYLEFSWNKYLECTNILVANSSLYEPKQP